MHGRFNNARTGGFTIAGVRGVGDGMNRLAAYRKGQIDERKAFRRKIGKMLEQIRSFERVESSRVTLQELTVWLNGRETKVTEKAALEVAEAFQAECIRQGLMRM